MSKTPDIIVSRHAATIEFIAARFGCEAHPNWPGEVVRLIRDGGAVVRVGGIPVVPAATPADLAGKVAAGNMPLHLAACCREVIAVLFRGEPPRGVEYTGEQMRQAGAYLARFAAVALGPVAEEGVA